MSYEAGGRAGQIGMTAPQEKTMKTATVCACIIAALLVSGCASTLQFARDTRKITIESDPEGALVYQLNPVNESERIFLGTTPLKEQTVQVPTRVKDLGAMSSYAAESQLQMVHVMIEKDGYRTFESNLSTMKDETVRHDVTLERK
jgi:hypothetical protein